MDAAVFPADIMWRIVKYSQNPPLVLMLVCKEFSRNVWQHHSNIFKVTALTQQCYGAIGILKHMILLGHGKHLRMYNPKSLYIRAHGIADSDIIPLGRLTLLDISERTSITDNALSRLTTLTHLNIMSCPQITQAGISTLTRVRHLQMSHNMSVAHMPLVHLKIRDPCGGNISESIAHTTLRELQLHSCDARGYDKLPLKTLSLRKSDRKCIHLTHMTTVTNLTIRDDDHIRDDDIIGLNLTSLSVSHCSNLSDRICAFTALQQLYVDSCINVSGTCLIGLIHLRDLSIIVNADEWWVPYINNAISEMASLTSLNIIFTRISDRAISQLTNLTSLMLGRESQVTNQGLHALTNLTQLFISGNSYVTNDGLAHLAKLTHISASKTQLTQDCARGIYRYRSIYTGSRGDDIIVHVWDNSDTEDSDYLDTGDEY